MPVLAVKAAAGLLAATGLLAGSQSAMDSSASQASIQDRVTIGKVMYTVKPGDTLSRLAAYFCHSAGKYRVLAAANGLANPNVIRVGQRLWMACGGTGGRGGASVSSGASSTVRSASGSSYAAGSAVIPGSYVVYSYAGLMRLWIAAGGSSATAAHAACIAEHESGGRQWVVSPTNDWGLWQIHAGGPAMLNAFANAQRAVAMSGNGTNWGPWTTARYC